MSSIVLVVKKLKSLAKKYRYKLPDFTFRFNRNMEFGKFYKVDKLKKSNKFGVL